MAKSSSKKSKPAKSAPAASPAPGDRGPAIDIGLSTADRKKIAQGLSVFLSDAYTLYLKTHNFHWNVTGPMFNSLHTMFMDQYTEQWTALDETAERIRALGFNAPGSYAEFIKLTTIKEEPGLTEAPDWRARGHYLEVGNEADCQTARKVLKTADDASDNSSVDRQIP